MIDIVDIIRKIFIISFFYANKPLRLRNDYIIWCPSEREKTHDHRVPSINCTYNMFNYFVTLANKMTRDKLKKKEKKGNEGTNNVSNKRITRTNSIGSKSLNLKKGGCKIH